MEISLIIISSLALIFQFLVDYLVKSKKKKFRIGIFILTLGLGSIWFAFIDNNKNKRLDEVKHQEELSEQKNRFNRIDSINQELNTEIKIRNKDLNQIKFQNDSLIIRLHDLNKSQEKYLTLTEFSAKEISKSRNALENIGLKTVSRGVSEYDKIQILGILKRFKGSELTLTSIMGDSESFKFAHEIKELFELANWKVNGINQAMYTVPKEGVIICVNSKDYPKRVNGIFESFKLINIIAKGELKPSLESTEVELIIGTK
ncbi:MULTISPECIES: hypothetical protein [Flavobacteriaceae]|uniref:hypothetical protein n=1 Tax=Flavobacteriaceae TaxID=49546 RepID=UPI00149322C0|nr:MULTISPECIES: hypothetical protein [Allomuricauda]MDC6365524.1 hypothetical protein [Muricauda sp. AC10]